VQLVAQATAYLLDVQALIAGTVQELGEGVHRVEVQGQAESDPGFRLVVERPGDPTRERERRRSELHVRGDAAPCQRPPEPEGEGGFVALHPLSRPVACLPYLETKDHLRRFSVPDQLIVTGIGLQRSARRRRHTQLSHHSGRHRQGLVRDLLALFVPQHAWHKG